MAYEHKTKVLSTELESWLAGVEPPERRDEARRLIDIFSAATGWQPKLYTGNMVGFGSYAYTYESGHSGVSLATGFSPRKAELSIYGLPGEDKAAEALARLGKHRRGKGCLYLKRLSDADEEVLTELIRAGLADLGTRWDIRPT